jgi:hypothetical protein
MNRARRQVSHPRQLLAASRGATMEWDHPTASWVGLPGSRLSTAWAWVISSISPTTSVVHGGFALLPRGRGFYAKILTHLVPIRACSVSSQSMWIEWDWMGLNPKQVKLLLNFFPIPSNPCVLGITEQTLRGHHKPWKTSFPSPWPPPCASTLGEENPRGECEERVAIGDLHSEVKLDRDCDLWCPRITAGVFAKKSRAVHQCCGPDSSSTCALTACPPFLIGGARHCTIRGNMAENVFGVSIASRSNV